MALLNSVMSFFGSVAPTIWAPDKLWHILILDAFSFVADYGWRIVVFTVLLKLVLSPLDFFQRYKMRKNQRITERLKPTMEKLQKQYGNDKQAFSRAQMELNRKEGYSYFSSCLPMILTLVIFITLWQSMNTIASYMTCKQYVSLYDGFTAAETAVVGDLGDDKRDTIAKEVGQDVVVRLYYDGITEEWIEEQRTGENGIWKDYGLSSGFTDKFMAKLNEAPSFDYTKKQQANFLWIQNIWAPDVPWEDQAILSHDKFRTTIEANNYHTYEMSGLDSAMLGILDEAMYNKVMGKLINGTQDKTNGYLVLPILVLLLSVGSQLITSIQQKRAGQVNAKGGVATSMKVMMFLMPALMLFFSLQYASIFTLYMAVNSATSLILNTLFTSLIKLGERRRSSRHYGIATGSTRGIKVSDASPIIHYIKGANPNAGAKPVEETVEETKSVSPESKKEKRKKGEKTSSGAVKRSGRPDPHELMNLDMSNRGKKK